MQKLIIILLLFVAYQSIAQKVGINNTDPQTSLDVNGKLRIRSFGVSATAPTTTLPNGQYGYYSLYGSPGSNFSITMPTGVKGTFIIIENTTNYDASIVGLCKIKPGESRLLLHGDTGWILANDSESQLERITEAGLTGWRLLGRNPNNYGDIGVDAIDFSINHTISSSIHGATGQNSVAMGNATRATALASTAFGYQTKAIGENSTSMGMFTEASGTNSTSMGSETTSSGENSTAFGNFTKSKAYCSVALGRYNDEIISSNPTDWVDTDPLFLIGNGSSTERKNAMTVYKNGNTDLNGFVRIGDIADGAPRIKTKKMVIASGPNVDSYQNYAFGSGITDEKVLGIEVLLNYSSTYKIPPGYLNTDGYQYDAQVQYNGVTILLKSGNSANIGQKPITILVTYEE